MMARCRAVREQSPRHTEGGLDVDRFRCRLDVEVRVRLTTFRNRWTDKWPLKVGNTPPANTVWDHSAMVGAIS